MKRWLVVLTLLVLLLTINSVAFAANGVINVSMNGSSFRVKEVGVLLDGQAFESEVPSFIYGDRTLVPIRFVAEKLGAEVGWDQATRTATVTRGNDQMKLTIDSNKVTVNKEVKTVDNNSTPRLVTFGNNDSRTMVPVRFISEAFGYEVGWDPNRETPFINSKDESEGEEVVDLNPIITPNPEKAEEKENATEIKNVQAVKGSTPKHRVIISSEDEIEYDVLFLPDSNKLVIDIENSVLNTSTGDKPQTIGVNDGNIKSISYSQHTTSPYTTRVVVDLYDECDYDIHTSKDGKTTTITFEENTFDGISIENSNGKESLVIEDIGNVKYNVMTLNSPKRLVVDLMDTNLANQIYEYDLQLGSIKGVRVSQFGGDNNYSSNDRIVRLVFDIKDGVSEPNVSIERVGDDLIITPAKSIWEFISYDNKYDDKYISIQNNEETNYDLVYDPTSKTMSVTMPTRSTDIPKGTIEVEDNFVNSIEVTESYENTVVSIRFTKGIEYNLLSSGRDDKIELTARRDPNISVTDKTIVIDSGHGGKDPGAVSPNGTREKDVNLNIALKTQSKLEALGHEVIMTRSGDTNPALSERANIANRNDADVFLSIHHNSAGSSSAYGLEILYCPRGQGNGKTEDQYPLAESISKGIIASTGGRDRGIIKRPDLAVLRQTKMPAVMVEVGYLSNAAEEARILDGSYQDKVVQGIVNGIQNYFDEY